MNQALSSHAWKAILRTYSALLIAASLVIPSKNIGHGPVPKFTPAREEIVLYEEKPQPERIAPKDGTQFVYWVDECKHTDIFFELKGGKVVSTDTSKVAIGMPWSAPSLSGSDPLRNRSFTNVTFKTRTFDYGPRYYDPDMAPEKRLKSHKMREDTFENPNPSNPYGPYRIIFDENNDKVIKFMHATNQPSSLGKNASHGCIRNSRPFIRKTVERILEIFGIAREWPDWRATRRMQATNPVYIRLHYNPIEKVSILPGPENDTLAVKVGGDPYQKAPEMLRQIINNSLDSNIGFYTNDISFTWGTDVKQPPKPTHIKKTAFNSLRAGAYTAACSQFAHGSRNVRVLIPNTRPIQNAYTKQKVLPLLR